MSERQREYFRVKLLAWKEDILKEVKETLQHLQDQHQNHPDIADRASSETDRANELRARPPGQADCQDRYCHPAHRRWHLWVLRRDRRADFDQAARSTPIAMFSIEAQERHEQRERVYRND
jgi:DnaK suppressor protein